MTSQHDHYDDFEHTGAGMTYVTGDEIWEIAKRWARQENPDGADALIAELEKRHEPRGLSAAERPVAGRVTPHPVAPNTQEEGT